MQILALHAAPSQFRLPSSLYIFLSFSFFLLVSLSFSLFSLYLFSFFLAGVHPLAAPPTDRWSAEGKLVAGFSMISGELTIACIFLSHLNSLLDKCGWSESFMRGWYGMEFSQICGQNEFGSNYFGAEVVMTNAAGVKLVVADMVWPELM